MNVSLVLDVHPLSRQLLNINLMGPSVVDKSSRFKNALSVVVLVMTEAIVL